MNTPTRARRHGMVLGLCRLADGLNFMTELYRYVLKTFGTLQFKLGDFDIDLSKDWEEWDYAETIQSTMALMSLTAL